LGLLTHPINHQISPATLSVKALPYICSKKQPLEKTIKQELLNIEEGSFFNDLEVRLSENSLIVLEQAGLKIFSKMKRNKDIIDPRHIKKRSAVLKRSWHVIKTRERL